jgi:hypothetical protein
MSKKRMLASASRLQVEGDFELPDLATPKRVKQAIEIISKLPKGKLIRIRGLAARMQLSDSTLLHYTCHPAIRDHKVTLRNRTVLFGAPATIRMARKELGL